MRSSDGINWEPFTDTPSNDFYLCQDFAESQIAVVAVGSKSLNPPINTSFTAYLVASNDISDINDGWTALPVQPTVLNYTATAVAFGTPGGVPTWVIGGQTNPAGVTIVYASGAELQDPFNIDAWTVATSTSGPVFDTTMQSVVWTGSAFVGVGLGYTITGSAQNVMLMSSPTGAAWTSTALANNNPLDGGQGYLFSIAWTGRRLLVVGKQYNETDSNVWYTDDPTGLSGWQESSSDLGLPYTPYTNGYNYAVGIGADKSAPSHWALHDAARKLWTTGIRYSGLRYV